MKKILLILCLGSSLAGLAQMKEGRVVYERTMMFQRPVNMDPEMAKRIPQSRTEQFELLFGNNQSLWQVIPSEEGSDITVASPNGNAVFRMGGGGNEILYYNGEQAKQVAQREMFERTFLVEDSVRRLNWKLTDETKTILTYTVKKATAQRIGTRSIMAMENGEMKRQEVADTTTIIAWFTTQIPGSYGPQEFQGQLPGTILELNMNNGRIVFKAIEVSPKVNLAAVKEPKKGKRMTQAEYMKERIALMEEMRKNMPAGQSIQIRQ
jgi:GLPGLI family protein